MPKQDAEHLSVTIEPETVEDSAQSHRFEATESPSELFERILEAKTPRSPWPVGEPFVAECTDTHHPTLLGRVRIRWGGAPSGDIEIWVPALHGQTIRKGDRLLVQTPHGGGEPIAVGVIDGFLPRPEPDRTVAAQIEVKRDEVLQVCTQEGQALVEIVSEENGPVVRLLQSDTRIDIQGKLSITASELEFKAVKGEVRIQASDDLNLVGEAIHLN
ncbi:MAG: hypothetical protein ABSB49_12850 [Polyangia bacterium]|jgi:hypothetical protein